MEPFLDEAQGAQPAADHPAQGEAQHHEDAQHVPGPPAARGGQGVLQRAQGASPDGAGAGIAIKARHAQGLEGAGVDIALDEALEVGVVQQGGVKLNQPPPGGNQAGQAGRLMLSIQGQYTPYRCSRL